MKLDIKMLIATLIAGIAGAVLDAVVYSMLKDSLPSVLLIPMMILILAVIVVVTIMVVAEMGNNTDDSFLFLDGKAMIIVGVVVCLVILALLSGLFQWLYETEFGQGTGPTSYIFILDESGSMETNDADCQRYTAVQQLMATIDKDFPYAAYAFADECMQIRDMLPVSEGILERPENIHDMVGELTYIQKAMNYVYGDITNGVIEAGERPHVILLTDGIANDMETFLGSIVEGGEIVDEFASAGIMISTVGLSDNVDVDLLTQISGKTNGNYVQVDHAAQLAQGFTSVAAIDNNRDLFSERNTAGQNVLYALMRILFLTVIGVVLAFIKAMATGRTSNTGLVLLVGAITALVGSLLVEFGAAIGLPALILSVVYLILVSVTPTMVELIYSNNTTNYIHSYQDLSFRSR